MKGEQGRRHRQRLGSGFSPGEAEIDYFQVKSLLKGGLFQFRGFLLMGVRLRVDKDDVLKNKLCILYLTKFYILQISTKKQDSIL